MKVELLADDLEGLDVPLAYTRGAAALGARPTYEKPRAQPGTAAAVDELVHLYAAEAADMRMLQFAYATKAGAYHRSESRFNAVDAAMRDVRRELVPDLRAQLRTLRADEAALERELAGRGLDPAAIGPHVPPGTAIDPTLKPGEGEEERRALPPLPPRRTLLERVRGLLPG